MGETLMWCDNIKVGVVLPSRGLMFSRTAEEILANLKNIPHKIYFAHKLPIPDCFNVPTLQALEDETITHIWYIEDDMALPSNTLINMIYAHAPVVTCDYPVTKEGKGAVFRDKNKDIIFTGTGCLLVEREVFEKLPQPYFRSDIRWTPFNYGTTVKLVGRHVEGEGYGLHDVTFGISLYKHNIPIVQTDIIAQRKLIKLGQSGSNNGAHKIEMWQKIKKDYALKRILSGPLAIGARGMLITVDTPTGGIRTTLQHAQNLIKQGLATPINEKKIIIDDEGVTW